MFKSATKISTLLTLLTLAAIGLFKPQSSLATDEVYFSDDFESGMGQWSAQCDWGLSTAVARGGLYSLTDSPVGTYLANSDCSATLSHPLDLSGAVDPVLRFWHRGFRWYNDYVEVQVSSDGGTSWYTLRSYGPRWDQSTWSQEQVDLGDWKSGSVLLRFRLTSDASYGEGDGIYIDDVEVVERDAQRLAFPFQDGFEGGLGNWTVSGHDWDLTTTPARAGSHSLTDSPVGTYLANSDCSATLSHPLDLSGAVDPVLRFWHRGFRWYNDYVEVQVSSDGGTSWYTLRSYGPRWDQSTWSQEQVDLGDWKSGSVLLRFRLASEGSYGEEDGIYIDDVEVVERDAQRLAFPFQDDFEGGLGNWTVSGHDWDLTDTHGRTLTHSLTDSPTGDYIPYTNAAATLAHPIDLTNTTHPILWFWHRGTIGGGDTGHAQVSSDGGTSWVTLGSWSNWQQEGYGFSPPPAYAPGEGSGLQFDLTPYISDKVMVRFCLSTTGVADGWYIDDVRIREISDLSPVPTVELPTACALENVFPNPFNPSTKVTYALPREGRVRLAIYDAAGRLVRTLLDEVRPAGRHEVRWDGADDSGGRAASGLYLLRMTAGDYVTTRSLTLLK